MAVDWTRIQTISAPDEIVIKYRQTNAQGVTESKSVTLISTPSSTSESYIQQISYNNNEGQLQTSDVQLKKIDSKRTTVAAVNPDYITWRLSNGLGLPVGDVINTSETTYEYAISTDGPKLIQEQTSEYITEWQLAGSLAIKKYNNYTPTSAKFESQRTIILHDEWIGDSGRAITRTRTSRWMSRGLSQEGQQMAQRMCSQFANSTDGSLAQIVEACKTLVFEGTEVQINAGKTPLPEVPSKAEMLADSVINGDNLTDTTGNGIPDWAQFDPTDPTDYDYNGDGISDWIDPSSFYDPNDLGNDSNADNIVNNRRVNSDYSTTGKLLLSGVTYDSATGYPLDPDTGRPVKPVSQFTVRPVSDFTVKPVGQFQLTAGGALINPSTGQPYNPAITVPINSQTGQPLNPDVGFLLRPGTTDPYNPGITAPIDLQTGQPLDRGTGFMVNPSTGDLYNPPVKVPVNSRTGAVLDQNAGYLINRSTGNIDNPPTRIALDPRSGLPSSSAGDSASATYTMPFAPDDTFQFVDGVRTLVPGGAAAAADRFGATESALDFGHAYGQNIVTSFDRVPTLALSPIYLRQAGIEGAFMLDSVSYAWGPDGMVVSSDLMLIGVTGWYGNAAPSASWLRLPIDIQALQQAPSTNVENAPAKANTINLPNSFDARNPASTLLALPDSGSDVFAEWTQGSLITGPTLKVDIIELFTKPVVRFKLRGYSLAVIIEELELFTASFIDDLLSQSFSRVSGTQAPVLGASAVSANAATAAGYTHAFNGAEDEASIEVGQFPFTVAIDGTAYSSCFVTSNGYLTFEDTAVVYSNLSASRPSVAKLHFGSGDWSYQDVYAKIETNLVRIRWEGNTDYAANNSNRYLEVTFFRTQDNGKQYIEVRSGNLNTTAGVFMLASSTTSLATGSMVSNQSYVFEGNQTGTIWSLYTGFHIVSS